jgi:hypothetical protein
MHIVVQELSLPSMALLCHARLYRPAVMLPWLVLLAPHLALQALTSHNLGEPPAWNAPVSCTPIQQIANNLHT